MDNITHSMIGITVGEAAYQFSPQKSPPRFRALCHWVSLAANNLPDIDFAYIGITGGKLGYLLHHRGHTHTLVAALPALALLLPIAWVYTRFRKTPLTRVQWVILGSLVLAGHHLHLGMDYLNHYGLHPFWPWNNRWFYGDSLFIIEPWLWVLLAASLFSLYSGRAIRILCFSVAALGVILGAITGFVPPWILIALTAASLLWGNLLIRLPARAKAIAAVFCWVTVTLAFVGLGRSARRSAELALKRDSPQATLIDLVLHPHPGNPLCWGILAAEKQKDRYRVRRGNFALVPAWLPATNCRNLMPGRGTAQLTSPTRTIADDTSPLDWHGEYNASIKQLRELKTHCVFAAFLRYSRVPYWKQLGKVLVFGDLRYDRSESLDFADDRAPASPNVCPTNLPPWVPPQWRLLHRRESP